MASYIRKTIKDTVLLSAIALAMVPLVVTCGQKEAFRFAKRWMGKITDGKEYRIW